MNEAKARSPRRDSRRPRVQGELYHVARAVATRPSQKTFFGDHSRALIIVT
jgi:hypothetical protein